MKKTHDIRIDRSRLHPWLDYKLTFLLNKCAKKGIYLIITEGYRSKEYQDQLYAKGRTAPGNIVTNAKGSDYSSQHQWGIAFDIAINDNKLLYDTATIKKVAKIAKAKGVGLAWGGDWTNPVDMPHFYLKNWGATTTKLKTQYGTPEKFSASWEKTIKGTKKGLNLWKTIAMTKSLKRLPNGTKVKVLNSKSIFYRVKWNGKIGYLKKKYLK